MYKNLINFIFIIILLFSCPINNIEENSNGTKYNSEKIKQQLCPDAFVPAWAIQTVEKMFIDVGYGQTKINDIPQNISEKVLNNLYSRLAIRQTDFQKIRDDKYSDCSNDISFENIQKGDILLSVTHNALLMAASSENDVIHASLCINTPKSNDEIAFLSIQSMNGVVTTFPLTELQKNASLVFVLRYNDITDKQIDTICDYAEKQLGKPYNMTFTDKWDETKFYCTQLIWRAYLEAGLQIDYDNDKYNDYGVVFARDILRCDKLKVIKYSY